METFNYQALNKGKKPALTSIATKLNELVVKLLEGLKSLSETQAAKTEAKNNEKKGQEIGSKLEELLIKYNIKIVKIKDVKELPNEKSTSDEEEANKINELKKINESISKTLQ